jgi:hypothetical protein
MRIPIIQAETNLPSTTYPVEPYGLKQQAQLGQSVQGLIDTISEEQGRIARRQKELNDATDIANTELNVIGQNEDLVKTLRMDPDPNNYINYYNKWQTSFDKIVNKNLETISDKEKKLRTGLALKNIQIREIIDQKHYGNMLWANTQKARIDNILESYGEQQDEEKGLKLITTGETIGLYLPTEAENLRQKFSKDLEIKKVKNLVADADMRIFNNPNKANEILHEKIYDDIPDDKKVILLNKGIIEANRIEKNIENEIKKQSEILYSDFKQKIRAGQNIESDIYARGPNGDRSLTKQDFDSLLSDIDSLKKGGIKSDPDIVTDVTIRSNASIPRISESEINNLMRTKKLSVEDGAKALDQIRITNRSLKNEAESENNQRYSDAEKYITRGMGISGLVLQLAEKIDPTQQGLISRALSELWQRSKGRGGKEDPMTIAQEILPVYQKALKGQNLLSIESYKKIIDIVRYPTKEILLKNKYNISEADYYRKAKAFAEMEEKINLQGQLDALEKNMEKYGR